MLVDANILLYAVDATSRSHDSARRWLSDQLNAPRRTGLPWPSLLAFVRISTHPRASDHPLEPGDAWAIVEDWLRPASSWIPDPTDRHAEVLGGLLRETGVRGRLVPDAHLAALAVEHGLRVASADSDFARFPGVDWHDPTTGEGSR